MSRHSAARVEGQNLQTAFDGSPCIKPLKINSTAAGMFDEIGRGLGRDQGGLPCLVSSNPKLRPAPMLRAWLRRLSCVVDDHDSGMATGGAHFHLVIVTRVPSPTREAISNR